MKAFDELPLIISLGQLSEITGMKPRNLWFRMTRHDRDNATLRLHGESVPMVKDKHTWVTRRANIEFLYRPMPSIVSAPKARPGRKPTTRMA
jgi:hypothetical protein